MRNGDGPVRDEERGTRELPAEGGALVPRGQIPEQARPHPEEEPSEAGVTDDGQREQDGAVRIGGVSPVAGGPPAPTESSVGEEAKAQEGATGQAMSEHERDDVAGTQSVQVTRHDPQDRSGARALFIELRTLNDGSVEYAELRNRLVRMHLPLVEHLARRFRNRGEPLDDLTQVATIGLIKSVDRFDPERGVEFSTYATPTVVGEIKRHFRDKGWAVRVPRRLQELRLSLTTATAELSQRHGRSPTVHELAEKLGISEEEVLEGLESANAYSTLSLDVPDTDDESPAVADTLGAYDEALEGVEYRESLKPLLEDLPPREKRILLLRFFGNMTQSQIAQEVGISQMHVSRLLARTLAQLREKLLVEE
ncbi:RNA polymerase sigma factor SigF [Streptomyces sp. MBT65]|uniref:RNA polymerase sigma factor SigF n=1 Tax=Streptomyces sp. MBT65 TaxID=1488395 RepID=UPI00190AF324|nr:RNA polymerase sigma factor SigF [Streptomyces sp. MBT65]MBK3578345.1 RNA polymerase sigma factor SigF [Streptomyces sp. MBT65]